MLCTHNSVVQTQPIVRSYWPRTKRSIAHRNESRISREAEETSYSRCYYLQSYTYLLYPSLLPSSCTPYSFLSISTVYFLYCSYQLQTSQQRLRYHSSHFSLLSGRQQVYTELSITSQSIFIPPHPVVALNSTLTTHLHSRPLHTSSRIRTHISQRTKSHLFHTSSDRKLNHTTS